MVDGQVGFHRPENVRRCKIAKNNTIVRQLEKTKTESHPDLAKEQQDRLNEIQRQNKAQRIADDKKKKMEELEKKREKEERSYDRIMGEHMMTSNAGELGICCSRYNMHILIFAFNKSVAKMKSHHSDDITLTLSSEPTTQLTNTSSFYIQK